MQKYVTNLVVVVAGLYAVYAGVLVLSVVLEWAQWPDVKEWLVRGVAVAGVFVVINVVVAFLMQLLPHSDNGKKKK